MVRLLKQGVKNGFASGVKTWALEEHKVLSVFVAAMNYRPNDLPLVRTQLLFHFYF